VMSDHRRHHHHRHRRLLLLRRHRPPLLLPLPLLQISTVEKRRAVRSCRRAGRRFGMRSMKGTTTITKLLKSQHGRGLCTDRRLWGRRPSWCCPRRRRRWCRHRQSRRPLHQPLPPPLPPNPTFKKRQTTRSCPRAGRRFGMRSMKGTITTTRKLERQNGKGLCTDRRRWGHR